MQDDAKSQDERLKNRSAEELLEELRRREREPYTAPSPGAAPKGVPGEAKDADTLKSVPTDALVKAAQGAQKVIYGVDDRQDLFQVTDTTRVFDADSVVSLFRNTDVVDNGNGTSTLRTVNFGTSRNLCSGERFREQPIGAFCSGFLVAPDIVATAGHCASTSDVTTIRFVFGFRMNNATTAQTVINNSEIYRGVSIVGRKLETSGSDWALVKLDRPVPNHRIVDIRRGGVIPNNQAIHVIGHPVGLPIKVAGGANVRDNTPSPFFVANLDTYGGNSGSPVFNSQTHQAEGILVRGETDFTSNGNCMVSLVCPSTGCRGEDVTRTMEFAALVPAWRREAEYGSDAPPFFQNYAPGNFNYEVVVREGTALRHYWCIYGSFVWTKGALFGSSVVGEPVVFQNKALNNFNYEVVYCEGTGLRHYWFNYGNGTWSKGALFASGVSSAPAAFQNSAPNNFNYEVVVREGAGLRHYWFNYGNGTWNKGALFGASAQGVPAMFQNRAPNNFNYEVVVREGSALRHYWFNYGNGTWNKGALFGSNVQGDPVMFQNRASGNFNYEVLVREGTALRHYWFNYGNGTWNKGALIGSNVAGEPAFFQNYAPGNFNYEVVVREGAGLRHYWFNYGNLTWSTGQFFGSNIGEEPSIFQNHAPVNDNYELLVRMGGFLRHFWFAYGGDWQWHQGAQLP